MTVRITGVPSVDGKITLHVIIRDMIKFPQYDKFPYKAELERRIYGFLGQEETRDEATYLQALVEADGDETRAKAAYFKLRFRQMLEEGQVIPFMVNLLIEKGDICTICHKPIGKKEARVKRPEVSELAWAHVACVKRTQDKKADTCAICGDLDTVSREVWVDGIVWRCCLKHDYETIPADGTCGVCRKKIGIFHGIEYHFVVLDDGFYRIVTHSTKCSLYAMRKARHNEADELVASARR